MINRLNFNFCCTLILALTQFSDIYLCCYEATDLLYLSAYSVILSIYLYVVILKFSYFQT
jgi:hypothetical protein